MPDALGGRVPQSPDLARLQQHLNSGLAAVEAGGGAAAVVTPRGECVAVYGEATPGEAATTSTVFHICSCSKTFTAAVMSLLVQEGVADWDTPASDVVPEFRTRDATVNRRMTLRDLASMRVGLSRNGIAEWGMRQGVPKAERLEKARSMEMSGGFRNRFGYSNLCYIALSLAAERLAGRSFPELVRELAGPLGMETTMSAGFGVEPPSGAAPHMLVSGHVTSVRDLTGPNSEGSARIHLSGDDAVRWLRFLLEGMGGSDTGPLTAASLAAMAAPAASVPDPDVRLAPEGGKCTYGMGLYAATFLGQRQLRHGGGGRGWRHAMVLLPDRGTGVLLMASAESPRVEGLALELLELACGRAPRDWQSVFESVARASARNEQKAIEAKFPAPPGETAVKIASGVYDTPVTGTVCVEARGSGARIAFDDAPDFNAVLESCGGAAYRFEFDELALRPQPLDPPFRLLAVGFGRDQVLRTTYFGELRRAG